MIWRTGLIALSSTVVFAGACSDEFQGPTLTTTVQVALATATMGNPLAPVIPVTASGGRTPYSFALSGGTLPAGIVFSTTNGELSGTPTATLVTTTFTVTVTDGSGQTSASSFALVVNGPLVTTQLVASRVATVGGAITPFVPVSASGGTTPHSYALSGGTLPAGVTFSTTSGQIGGTPAAAFPTTTLTVTVTDAVGAKSSKTFTFTVNTPLNTVQAVGSRAGTVGIALVAFVPVTASGGTTPYTFALSGGTLPTGLAFNTTSGQVAGTPAVALATTTFTVTVTDAGGATSSKTFTLTINGPLATTQAIATRGATINTALVPFTPVTASGGTTPYGYALSGGTLPNGVTFNTTTGALSGTPTATFATTTFTVTVTDAVGATSAKTFAFTVNGVLVTTQAVATRGATLNTALVAFAPVTATGGTAPYGYALSGGTLPAGLSFSTTTGQLSGTPVAILATTTFTVTVTDAAGATSFKTFAFTVNGALVTVQAVASRATTVGTPLIPFAPVTASGGTTPYRFAVTTGTLPAGLALSPTTGTLSGTPTATLTATALTITVTDTAGATSSKTFTLTVNGALTTTQAVATSSATVGTAIVPVIPVTASGGTTPYTFALSGGTLPNGLTFNSATGQLAGTPTAGLATTVFTVTVADAAGAGSAKTFSLTVNGPVATVLVVPSQTVTVGTAVPLFAPVTASGGTLPYSYAVSGGSLPNGLSFNAATGQLGGTPTTTLATTRFTVTVTDAVGATSAKTFCLASFPTGTLFRDDFTTAATKLDTCWWTTEIGPSSFLGRTQLADWITPGGVGQFVVGGNGAEVALNTFNPTGSSLYGTHGKTLRTFQPTGTETIVLTARVRALSLQPGIVYGIYFYGCQPATCAANHDEIDIELVTNKLQTGSPPLQVQLNRYKNEPAGAGHGGLVNLPAGFDPTINHDWTIRWSLSKIEYLVDGTLLATETTFVPTGPMQANVIAWGPSSSWPAAYSASLTVAASAGANQRHVAVVRNLAVTITP